MPHIIPIQNYLVIMARLIVIAPYSDTFLISQSGGAPSGQKNVAKELNPSISHSALRVNRSRSCQFVVKSVYQIE